MNKPVIVFDFGGVVEFLSPINPNQLASEMMDIPLDQFRERYFKYNHLSNVEGMPWLDMFEQVVRSFDVSTDLKDAVVKQVRKNAETTTMNDELLEWIGQLREQGYQIGLLSNYTTELRVRLAEKHITYLFDQIIISGEIGFQKPYKEAFDVVFSKFGVEASEVIFIDDAAKSLELSGEIGYVPILFKNNEQLKTDLLSLGVKI